MDAPRLIYIMGDGRSGSTVLATLLGNHPRFVSVGEISKWPGFEGRAKEGDDKEGLVEFWGDVLSAYQDQHTDTSFAQLVEVQNCFEDYGRLPAVLLGRTPRWAREIYDNHTIKLIRAIGMVSGNTVMVDSSKRMGRAYMMLRNPYLDAKVIHIVRDPRGALWSQLKRDVEQKHKKPLQALFHYWIKNLSCHLVSWFTRDKRVLRVRYEDISLPGSDVLMKLESFLGTSLYPLQELISADQPLVVEHLLDGNRLRRQRELRLRIDDAWRSGLSGFWKAAALLLTLPFSAVYGYWDAGARDRAED
jgi:hypothetical protein